MNKNMKITLAILLGILVVLIFIGIQVIYSLFLEQSGSSWKSENNLQLPVLQEDKNPDPNITEYELNVQKGQTEFNKGKFADTLGYNGSYLGPVLRMKKGETVNIVVNNKLDVSTTVHWHGLLVEGEQDGGPRQGIQAQESWNPSFIVDQPAATLWFHPHLVGTTADQVYFGLAGLIYIEDETSDKLNLPIKYGVDDIPLIIQDRNFKSDGSFDYRTSMMGIEPGSEILINGTLKPYYEINQEKTRLRVLNASNSENINLELSDKSGFQLIASDGGFLEVPITKKSLTLAPGERAEIIVDFKNTDQKNIYLMNNNKKILDFRISDNLKQSGNIVDSLAVIDEIKLSDNPIKREFIMESMGISGTINGKYFDMERIDEEVKINESEIWIIRNIGGMMQTAGHPFHVHSTQFQIISRNGKKPPLGEQGFKDTVFVKSGEEVIIRVIFKHQGIFMYHCHILEHEDNGMMGQFRVSNSL